MSDGYTVTTRSLRSASSVLKDYATDADAAKLDLDGNTMPPPEAGDGIGSEVTSFVKLWQELFKDVSTEFTAMSANVNSAADVYVTVEETNRQGMSRMNQFTQ